MLPQLSTSYMAEEAAHSHPFRVAGWAEAAGRGARLPRWCTQLPRPWSAPSSHRPAVAPGHTRSDPPESRRVTFDLRVVMTSDG